ncbi:hypothetical protein GN958_ATG19505 [Phytophthora infestans]|uniref:Uncharacterized protein n=1 Tax=Phytophthora infestans TaxID=4787 RepID=A0A8S9TRY7_PHYIN|nr:hypothetical protein GN958_ATG19505 [Phytophthora infestans]
MKNIGEDCWNGGDSGDTRDIKPLAYQQETPRSAASVQSEKPSQTTAWRPPALALVSTHVGFEESGEVLVEWSLDLWSCPEAHRDVCDVVSERVMEKCSRAVRVSSIPTEIKLRDKCTSKSFCKETLARCSPQTQRLSADWRLPCAWGYAHRGTSTMF